MFVFVFVFVFVAVFIFVVVVVFIAVVVVGNLIEVSIVKLCNTFCLYKSAIFSAVKILFCVC